MQRDLATVDSSARLISSAESTEFFAHSRPGAPFSEWELLEDHLREVAELAADFSAAFDSSEWGYLGGLWHDLGKYRPEFQRRIRGSREQVEHAGAGAALASDRRLLPLAFVIAGHHSGLANHRAQLDGIRRPLVERLNDALPLLEQLETITPSAIFDVRLPAVPKFLLEGHVDPTESKLATELWTRMLFSAVIDADRLCTEQFYEPRRRERFSQFDPIATLAEKLESRLDRFIADTPVNQLRAQVLHDCQSAAEQASGFFTLTVPTGGGKTLSAMSFALRHALKNDLERVITAVPYTTIIEQNADVYREALGEQNVIEHHSLADASRQSDTAFADEMEIRRRFAAENWDAPIIVTTTVQLFESLFSSHPSRCRKLHNVAKSVIVIDEAQALPPGFLLCIMDVMKALVNDYGCTIVLSTATQPALQERESLPQGISGVVEIAADQKALSQKLARVRVEWPRPNTSTGYSDLASELANHRYVLAIVHLRADARELASHLPKEGTFHLSALMCPAHRRRKLEEIKRALLAGGVCRAVTTQLVEAGVDIDFPVVYRALAGLDSLAQAAGRCNREGKLADQDGTFIPGRFVVFRAETKPPAGILRRALGETEKLLAQYHDALDFTDPVIMERYFRGLYMATELDAKNVQSQRALLNFATVGDLVRLIEDGFNRTVIVPFADGERALADYRASPNRRTARALQQYGVQVRERDVQALLDRGALEDVERFGYALATGFQHVYSDEYGLLLSSDNRQDVSQLIV